jgi:hypothetical protein
VNLKIFGLPEISSNGSLSMAQQPRPRGLRTIAQLPKEIQLSQATFASLSRATWRGGDVSRVEIFPDQFVSVQLVASDAANLESCLKQIGDEAPELGFAYRLSRSRCLFQFASPNSVLFVNHSKLCPLANALIRFFGSRRFLVSPATDSHLRTLGANFARAFSDFQSRVVDGKITDGLRKRNLCGESLCYDLKSANFDCDVFSAQLILYCARLVFSLFLFCRLEEAEGRRVALSEQSKTASRSEENARELRSGKIERRRTANVPDIVVAAIRAFDFNVINDWQ